MPFDFIQGRVRWLYSTNLSPILSIHTLSCCLCSLKNCLWRSTIDSHLSRLIFSISCRTHYRILWWSLKLSITHLLIDSILWPAMIFWSICKGCLPKLCKHHSQIYHLKGRIMRCCRRTFVSKRAFYRYFWVILIKKGKSKHCTFAFF